MSDQSLGLMSRFYLPYEHGKFGSQLGVVGNERGSAATTFYYASNALEVNVVESQGGLGRLGFTVRRSAVSKNVTALSCQAGLPSAIE
ncbi:hypothetical protein N7481_009292 [Penicillium waksmanii]|uniref:uncharacterized protein n=1 Tax=Penicillium waksmanii TaxID=69791 RepID=UPI002548AFA1|nr:uncharacterized protein N7481_009292 [Penicillium waksmanii]KAJ5975585.1 hypothetical protein N7481_009292 [Penicillium waksmanii]